MLSGWRSLRYLAEAPLSVGISFKSPFAERLVLPSSSEVILSRNEEIDSSGNDLFTSWAKLSEHEILVEHMVDIEKATAEFCEAYNRRDTISSRLKSSKKRFATRSLVQR